jgi:hypothetical protein
MEEFFPGLSPVFNREFPDEAGQGVLPFVRGEEGAHCLKPVGRLGFCGAVVFDDGQIAVGIEPRGTLIVTALDGIVVIELCETACGLKPGNMEQWEIGFGGRGGCHS